MAHLGRGPAYTFREALELILGAWALDPVSISTAIFKWPWQIWAGPSPSSPFPSPPQGIKPQPCRPLHIKRRAGASPALEAGPGLVRLGKKAPFRSPPSAASSLHPVILCFPSVTVKCLQWSWASDRVGMLQLFQTGLLTGFTVSCPQPHSRAARNHLTCITWLLPKQASSGPEHGTKSSVSTTAVVFQGLLAGYSHWPCGCKCYLLLHS